MKKIISKIYSDYPEQPYISVDRDLKHWEESPEDFPYGIVEKRQMVRTNEGLLPGDIVMLWRINFDNFTNETIFPEYFEYRYGVNSEESIERLLNAKLIEINNALDTLYLLNMIKLKKILKNYNLELSGKKAELLARIRENISIEDLENEFTLRKYSSTTLGKKILSKNYSIIEKHGPKKM